MSPVTARVMAVLATLGLVLGAVAVRDRLDGVTGDDQTITGPDPTVTTDPGSSGPGGRAAVVCATDLRTTCEALAAADPGLEVRYEDAGRTATALAATDAPDLDAWIVVSPWPQMVDAERQREGRAPLFSDATATLASSPLVMAVASDRLPPLQTACGGAVTWTCVGDAAGAPWTDIGGAAAWGDPKPGHASPDTALGALVVSQIAASRVGSTSLSTRDLNADAFRGWFTRLERSVGTFEPSAGTHLRQLLQFGPGAVDIVGTVEAEAAELLPRVGPRADGVTVIHADPLIVVDLVVASVGDALGDRLTDADAVLAATGWRTTPAPPTAFPDWPTLPEPGVEPPAPGAVTALRGVWREVVR